MFDGRRVGLKKHPRREGKCGTFWHMITEGSDEDNRAPIRERIERIGWPCAMLIEANAAERRVKVWRSPRTNKKRWLVAVEDFSYVLVLEDRGTYLLPWTAFYIREGHRRETLRREWAAYKLVKS
jgi:hypothetical protein